MTAPANRIFILASPFILLLAGGCSCGGAGGTDDAGLDAGAEADAGTDSGTPPGEDGGSDAGSIDAGADGGADAGDDAGTGPSLEEFASAWPSAVCKRLVRCGHFTSEPACEALVVSRYKLELDLGPERAAIAAGTATFDPDAAALCLEAFGQIRDCQATADDITFLEPFFLNARITAGLELLDACHDTFAGTVQEGGSCFAQEECARGLFCGSTTLTCPSQCFPQGSAGDPVGASPGCTTALFVERCENGDIACRDPLYNYEGSCRQRVSVGQSCQALSAGGLDQRCVPHAYCQVDSETCVLRGGVGVVCSGIRECLDGALCTDAKCALPRSVGEDCAIADCPLDLRCNGLTGLCDLPVQDGGTCDLTADCEAGLRCDIGSASCVPQSGAGGLCAEEADCSGDLHCDPDQSSCELRKGAGVACDGEPRECVPGYYCDFAGSTCIPQTCRASGE